MKPQDPAEANGNATTDSSAPETRQGRGALPRPPGAAPEVSADAVARLFFDFLRQLSTLSLAAAGGTVTLMQTVFRDTGSQFVLVAGVGALFLAAMAALQAQQILVERLAEKTTDLKPTETAMDRFKMERTAGTERTIMIVAFVLFGLGLGLVVWVTVAEFLL